MSNLNFEICFVWMNFSLRRIDAILKFIKKVDFIKKKYIFLLMHTRFGPELGLKSVSYYKPLNQMEPPVPKEANIPGRISENREFNKQQMAASAILPSQAKETYKVKGNVIDIMA